MKLRLLISLCLAAVLGCGPLNTANDIYSADSPQKSSARPHDHVSTGDPEMLTDKNRPVGSADWRDLPQ
jgi:hypothetical protein